MTEHKPGRELDALIAEKVLGHPDICFYRGDYFGAEGDWQVPNYSTDIKAAWEVVEKLYDYKFILTCAEGLSSEYWTAEFYPADIKAEGHTAPHAICLAALKALE